MNKPRKKNDPWVALLQVLLLVSLVVSSLASTTEHCDNDANAAAGREERRIGLSRGQQQPLPAPVEDNFLYDDEESPEMNMKMWAAIAESLRQWQQRKEEREAGGGDHYINAEDMSEPSTKNSNTKKSRRRRDEESVCYGRKEFCFKDKGPFDYLDTLPASPESIGTTFKLYTNANRPEAVKETGQFLDYDNATSLLVSHFNASADVKIIIHGFGSSSRRPWVLNITKALLDLDNFNVINVDWENGAKMPNYVQAAANTQLVGKQIAELIRLINYYSKLTPSRYHLIGFSLGAHVAGFTGMEFRAPNISRITGLDPAAPLFEGYDAGVRLDETDATFVDVIHSNGDGFIRGGLGSYTPMGTVDFYPNGGRVQAGCNSVLMGALSDIISGKWNSLCNHRRAFRLFLDSLIIRRGGGGPTGTRCTFRAFACPSYEEYLKGECFSCGGGPGQQDSGSRCADMGYFAHLSKARGKMYLMTRQGGGEETPHLAPSSSLSSGSLCGHQFRVRLDSSRDGQQGVTWGRLEITLISSNSLLKGALMNETFPLTSGESDEVKEGQRLQTILVAHSELANVTEVALGYTKYKGWIYNGRSEWNIDRVEIQDSSGLIKSYCHPRTKLLNTFSLRVPLSYGNCSLSQPTLLEHTNSLAGVGSAAFPVGPPRPPVAPPPVISGGQVPPYSLNGVGVERKPGGGESVGHSENDIDSVGAGVVPTGVSSPTTVAENTWGVIVRKYGDFFAYDDQQQQQQQLEQTGQNNGNSSQNEHSSGEHILNGADNQLTSGGGGGKHGEQIAGEGGTISAESTTTTGGEEMMLGSGRLKPTPTSVLLGEYSSSSSSSDSSDPTNSNLLMRSADSSAGGPSSGARSSRILAASVVPQAAVVGHFGPTSRTMLQQGGGEVSPANESSGGGGITRWTRASTYLRNRTAALFNRLWTAHSHHSPVVVASPPPPPPLQTPLPPSPPAPGGPGGQLAYGSGHPNQHHHGGGPLIEPDGMNILTDYSTLAYYILSNPNTAIVTSQQMPPIDHSAGKYPSN